MVNQEIQSPYKRGGDDGLTFGAYLTVMFFSGIFSQYIPGANLVSSLMMLGVPAVTYFYLRRYFIKERGRLTVSALWMHGIVTFACGSLLAAFLMFIYMRWIEPDYLHRVWTMFVDVMAQSDDPGMQEIVRVSREAEAHKVQPVTPIIFSITTIMLAILSGSVLSLIIGVIVKAMGLPRTKNNNI